MDRAYDLPQNCIVIGEHSVHDPIGSVRRVPVWVQAGLLAAVYFAAAKLSLLLAIPPGYATAVWPPSGIALAATLDRKSTRLNSSHGYISYAVFCLKKKKKKKRR